MEPISLFSRSAPSRPARPLRVVIHSVWSPTDNLTHVLVNLDVGYDGLMYGPFEASCGCHSSFGPMALVTSALTAAWRYGPLGLENWEQESQHTCHLETPS